MLTLFDTLAVTAVAVICFYQLFYFVLSFKVRIRHEPPDPPAPPGGEKIAVVIPLYNSEGTVGRCLGSLLENGPACVAEVFVVLDHCTDASEAVAGSFAESFRRRGVGFEVLALPPLRTGKVEAIMLGGRRAGSNDVLLLDADIILEPTAVSELLSFHRAARQDFSSFLIFPFQGDGRGDLMTHVICNNRLYRQSVLQAVKNLFGVSNFPGGVQLVNYAEYEKLLTSGFLEDLVATYHLLSEGRQVAVLPRVLGYEVERSTLSGLFWQRIRWTIGAIENFSRQYKSAAGQKGWAAKVLISSYHVMWELQHYAITLGLLLAPLRPGLRLVLVLPWVAYLLQLARSYRLTRRLYRNSLPALLLHSFMFPAVITAAVVGSFVLLARKRSFYFRTRLLFSRE